MKYIVAFRIKAGNKNQVLEIFEKTGPNRQPGVSFRGAWIGTRSDIVFVLAEGQDDVQLESACQVWAQHGDYTIHPVIDIETY